MERTSPGAREVLCRLGMTEDFAAAAKDARRIGNVPVGREKLRLLVEAETPAESTHSESENHFNQSSIVIKLANSDRSLFARVTCPTIPLSFIRSTR